MKRNIVVYAMLLAVLISACGAQATPTIDGQSVQNTALASSFTLVAQTQAALPTNTTVPPTDIPTQTPLPTDTAIPSPTLETLGEVWFINEKFIARAFSLFPPLPTAGALVVSPTL